MAYEYNDTIGDQISALDMSHMELHRAANATDATDANVNGTHESHKEEAEDETADEEAETARDSSPDGRFLKFEEIGRGSFKTVYMALDSRDGVAVAWCELQLS